MSRPYANHFPRNLNHTRQMQVSPPWRTTPLQIAILKTMEEKKFFHKTIFEKLADVFCLSYPCFIRADPWRPWFLTLLRTEN